MYALLPVIPSDPEGSRGIRARWVICEELWYACHRQVLRLVGTAIRRPRATNGRPYKRDGGTEGRILRRAAMRLALDDRKEKGVSVMLTLLLVWICGV